MSQEVDEAIVTKVQDNETDGNVIKKELANVDVLVCGMCHVGFHFVEEFQEHKIGGSCKKISAFREQNTTDNKPQILGFLLWKNSQSKHIAEIQEAWKVYQMWCVLPESVKTCWVEAGKTINTYDELAKSIPNKIIKIDINPSNGTIEEQQPPVVMKPSGEFPSGQEFVVERVVARRFNQKKRQFEYLLKWEGYPPEQNTWEPAENMSACTHLIKQYEHSLVKNGTTSTPGKRPGPGRPRKIEQIQNMEVVKPKVSPQAVEQIGLGGRPVRSSKQKAMDQVKYWCGTMKANEDIVETKQAQPNVLKRDYVMMEEDEEDEDIPVLKKKYFHQDSEDEDWDDPSIHKSNASVSENDESNTNLGKIIARGQLTMEERIKFNVSRSIPRMNSLYPVLKREERVKKIKTHLSHFNNVHRNNDMGLLQISPHLTQVTLSAMKGFVKLETNQVPQSGIYLFSNTDGFIKLNDNDKTQSMMMMMKHRDEPRRGKVVYTEGAQSLFQPQKKILDIAKAREAVNQSSPLMKSYAKKPFVPPTKIQAAVKPRPFLHKVAAANPEFEKSLLQKHNSPALKTQQNNMSFVPRRTVHNRIPGGYVYNLPEQLEFWEDTASDTDDGGLSDHFPSEDVSIPPNSPNRPLTLCPSTGKRLMRAEGEKTPEPTPPSSPKPLITIDDSTILNRQNDNSALPTIIKMEPGTGNLVAHSAMMTLNEPEKMNINRTPQMQPQIRQSFVNYKDIPAASNSGLRMKKANSRPNNSNKSLHVSSGISKSHSSLNVPARKIQQKQDTQINQQFPGQQAILTDESGRLILSADDADSMITITGDDGMLYQVSAAQLAASGGTVLLAGNGEGDGQQCVFLTEDGNSMIQANTNQEGMIALDDFGNSVSHLMPQQIDLGNLVTDDAGNMYMKDNETGQYVPVSATEQGGQVVIQPNENFTQEPPIMQDDQDQLVAQIVDAGEPAPGGGPRKVVLQLPDGNLMVTEMDEEQFAALEMDK